MSDQPCTLRPLVGTAVPSSNGAFWELGFVVDIASFSFFCTDCVGTRCIASSLHVGGAIVLHLRPTYCVIFEGMSPQTTCSSTSRDAWRRRAKASTSILSSRAVRKSSMKLTVEYCKEARNCKV